MNSVGNPIDFVNINVSLASVNVCMNFESQLN